ncbi:MAG: 3-phosphoserine/phosphohydroxythreonine transaminase [Candidatus Kapabacteria bacterium]|nr:3-phosphoserine/phosphohydroxythreonine transaminase [Ignavibacteriota bacterium]MCW5884428.1 3-phosphoserine/phosphohydroxythreonine transaminase [Candidatus Kapabacteria bacterium]
MARAHNFNAGPAILPVQVVKETAEAVIDFNNLGMGIMEISHRSKDFDAVVLEAKNDLLKIMNLSADEYTVLFLGGGASMQFLMVPYNFHHTKADYILTGVWAKKAYKEGKFFGTSNVAATSEDTNFNYLPKEFNISPDADYVHITTNNTIYGTEFKSLPDTGNVPLVADMSSDFLGMDFDYSKCSLIYAGAQKNIGPSGVTVVILKKSWLEEKGKTNIPTMMSYKTHVENDSMFNTPPCLPIFTVGRTFKWILEQGGVAAIKENNIKKANVIYDVIDTYPEFYKGAVKNKEDRSLMNITWNLPTPELETKFINEAKALNMIGLKGHRLVGGIRASVYNASPIESAQALAKFMEEFVKNNK